MSLRRSATCLALLGALSACGSHYSYRTGGYHPSGRVYTPPGPPDDPWGPYVREAAGRFRVPETWVRAVMRQESGGKQYRSGGLTTSSAGAMGLMQVMPATYDGLRARYGLGDDPYDPHDNIMAGTGYIREMYDLYGAPGFLAAYNAGPARLDAYLAGNNELPNETVNYLASVAPRLGTGVAMSGPLAVYAGGSGYGAGQPSTVQVASAPGSSGFASAVTRAVLPPAAAGTVLQAAMEPIASPGDPGMPAAPVMQATMQPIASPGDPGMPLPGPPVMQATMQPIASPGDPGMPLLPTPVPAAGPMVTVPMPIQVARAPEPQYRLVAVSPPGSHQLAGAPAGGWAIQVGAFASPDQARAAAGTAYALARSVSPGSAVAVRSTNRPDGSVLFRARVGGMSGAGAQETCRTLRNTGRDCIVVPPGEI